MHARNVDASCFKPMSPRVGAPLQMKRSIGSACARLLKCTIVVAASLFSARSASVKSLREGGFMARNKSLVLTRALLRR